MTTPAFKTIFTEEWVEEFEQTKPLTLDTVHTEYEINGNQAVFLVSGSGNEAAVTRGPNGNIPASPANDVQSTATLEELHSKRVETRFNIETTQGDRYRIMQQYTAGVINRARDQQIITELNTATNDTGAASTASINLATHALAILGNNYVEMDGQISALISPAFRSYMFRDDAFTSADFVNLKPLADANRMQTYGYGYYEWAGVRWIVHPNLPGSATNAEKCFMYHSSAIGHAINGVGLNVDAEYKSEDDYSWCRASAFCGAKLLQNSGIVVMNHDASALAAS